MTNELQCEFYVGTAALGCPPGAARHASFAQRSADRFRFFPFARTGSSSTTAN